MGIMLLSLVVFELVLLRCTLLFTLNGYCDNDNNRFGISVPH